MKITEQFIKIEKTARYFIKVPEDIAISNVWFLLHGYAQLAKDFIEEFNYHGLEDSMIIAPEGLSKFYFRNKIGASWMTKEDRQNEINDYINYLDKVFYEVKSKYDLSSAKINLLGFSQGVHTASRWFIKSNIQFSSVIFCSSDFPEDVDFEKLRFRSEVAKLYFAYGKNDGVISGKRFEESIDMLKEHRINFEEVIFEGGHNVDKDLFRHIKQQ